MVQSGGMQNTAGRVSRWRAVSHTSKIHAEPPQAVQTKVIKARLMSSCHLEEGRQTFRADFNFYS